MKISSIKIFTHSAELPDMTYSNFFHSRSLFEILEKTPAHTPYMVVAMGEDGTPVAHMLAILRRRGSFLPPYLYTQGRIFGEGEYAQEADREMIFDQMIKAVTEKFKRKLCLYIEISDMSTKMFGYRYLRQSHYFPVHWVQVKNSLHSKDPEERINEKLKHKIEIAYKNGVTTKEAETDEEKADFYALLHNFYRLKIQKFTPPRKMIDEIGNDERGKIFIAKYKNRIIGGCACVYSDGNAYLWFLASRRKSYAKVHPNAITVWHAIRYAYKHNYSHINFMNVGLPFKRNPFREFILKFGGKSVGTYRWFRFSFGWMNSILSWLYKE